MSDPIEVAVPKNETEARELQNRLRSHSEELNTHLDANEQDWTAEAEAKFEAMQRDEAVITGALQKFIDNREAAAERRKSIGNSAAAFEAHLQNGSSRQRQRDVDEARRQAEDIQDLNDEDLCNLAVAGFIYNVTDRRPTAEMNDAASRYEAHLKSAIQDRQSKQWSSKVLTVDSADDDFVSYLQAQALSGLDIRNVLSTTNPSSTATGSGNKLYNSSFVNDIEASRLAYGGMNAVADIMTTDSGETLIWPTVNDTGNSGVVIAEATAPAAADPTFGEVSWGAYKISSKEIIVSRELIEDNDVRLISRISAMLGERIARAENAYYTTGTGSSQPTGIVTAASSGVTAAANNAVTFDEMIDLEFSVDPAYRNMSCRYMFNDSTLKLLRKLKDGDSNYLWSSAVNNVQAPATINGYGYTINQDMNGFTAAANLEPVIFGDLKCFKIRRVRGMRVVVTDELYSRTDQVGFFAWVRVDSNLLDAGTDPVKYIVTEA